MIGRVLDTLIVYLVFHLNLQLQKVRRQKLKDEFNEVAQTEELVCVFPVQTIIHC